MGTRTFYLLAAIAVAVLGGCEPADHRNFASQEYVYALKQSCINAHQRCSELEASVKANACKCGPCCDKHLRGRVDNQEKDLTELHVAICQVEIRLNEHLRQAEQRAALLQGAITYTPAEDQSDPQPTVAEPAPKPTSRLVPAIPKPAGTCRSKWRK